MANIVPNFEKRNKQKGIYSLVSITLLSGKNLKHMVKQSLYATVRYNKVIKNSQHVFVRSYLTNFISFYQKVTGFVYGRESSGCDKPRLQQDF